MAICRKKNLKIINLRAKNPHLLRFKIQTLWNHFWKVLSEFWQTWGNTWQYLHKILAQSFLAQKCRTAAGGEFLRVFNFIFDFFILNLVSGHLGIHLGIGQSAAFGKKMNVSLQNVKFWANVTNLTKDEISDGGWGICPDGLNWPQFCPTSTRRILNFSSSFFCQRPQQL